MRLFPDLTNQIGEGYFRQRSFEAVLSLRKNPRHAFLEVGADRTPLVDRIGVNRKRRWCCTGTIYVQQRDLSRRTRKHARSALAAFCHHQARFRELGERLSNERGVGVHTVGQGRRGDFLALEVTQGSHDVRGNRKLDAFHRHTFSRWICDAQRHNWLYLFLREVAQTPKPIGLTRHRRWCISIQIATSRISMTKEPSFVSADHIDLDPFMSSQTRERTLNAAIVQANISESFEEYLEICDAFYDDDIEITSDTREEPIRGKARVRSRV